MPHHHPFQNSFWSPTSSVDVLPNFSIGFQVLHCKLKQSASENKVIADYIKQRIVAEKSHAKQLSTMIPTANPFDKDIGGGLKRCFEVVYSESQESTKEHYTRAENLYTTALDPLLQFSLRYDRIITSAKQTVESQISHFEMLCRHMEQAKQGYQTKCKALLMIEPEYKQEMINVGNLEFFTRDEVWIWLQDLQDLTRDGILSWLTNQSENEDALTRLEHLEFLKKNADNNDYTKLNTTINKGFAAGFLGRWGNTTDQLKKLEYEMLESDKIYHLAVEKVEKMRTQVEQVLFVHYEEMESLELERIQTIKQVFISVAASLSNTIPRCKETFDNMMLYQETLEPDKDVQLIVEQYRTGQYNPRPILYENYFHGTGSGKYKVITNNIIIDNTC